MKRNFQLIDLDKLVIDGTNVRDEQWDADEQFITDVKTNEIMNPLLVRPLNDGRFGVVAGSRRFNAAVDAGLKQAPCFIEEMDDVTALGRSISENHYIKSLEPWMYATKIGLMDAVLRKEKCMKIIETIMQKTGLSDTSVEEYLAISTLPKEVLELMKSSDHRSKQIIERLKGMGFDAKSLVLDKKQAVYLARNLKGQSLDRLFATAAHVMTLSRDQMEEFVKQVIAYPLKSPDELRKQYDIMLATKFQIILDRILQEYLAQTALKKKVEKGELAKTYIRDGLRRDGCPSLR